MLMKERPGFRMEILVKVAWLALALAHAAPAAVFFAPALVEKLYGVSASGETGLLLVHRGALFLAVVAVSSLAALDPGSRRAAGIIVTISVLGFLFVYARAGMPGGALRTVALVDVLALAPLALVSYDAWRSHAA